MIILVMLGVTVPVLAVFFRSWRVSHTRQQAQRFRTLTLSWSVFAGALLCHFGAHGMVGSTEAVMVAAAILAFAVVRTVHGWRGVVVDGLLFSSGVTLLAGSLLLVFSGQAPSELFNRTAAYLFGTMLFLSMSYTVLSESGALARLGQRCYSVWAMLMVAATIVSLADATGSFAPWLGAAGTATAAVAMAGLSTLMLVRSPVSGATTVSSGQSDASTPPANAPSTSTPSVSATPATVQPDGERDAACCAVPQGARYGAMFAGVTVTILASPGPGGALSSEVLFSLLIGCIVGITARTIVTLVEHHALMVEITRQQRHYAELVEDAVEVMAICSAETFAISYISPVAEKVLGSTPDALVGQHICAVLGWDDDTRVDVMATMSHGESTVVDSCLEDQHLQASLTQHEEGFLVVVRDITGVVSLQQELRRRAYHDELTGLANRHGLSETMETALATMPEHVACLYMDLNGFKTINDTFGHRIGDDVLTHTATRLAKISAPGVQWGRFGGDEFVALVDTRLCDPDELNQTVSQVMSDPITVAGVRHYVHGAIGVSTASAGDTADDVLLRADTAMYEEKRRRKATTVPTDSREAENVAAGPSETGGWACSITPVVALKPSGATGYGTLISADEAASQPGLASQLPPEQLAHIRSLLMTYVAQQHQSGQVHGRVGLPCTADELLDPGFAEKLLQAAHQVGCPTQSLGVDVESSAALMSFDAVSRTMQRFAEAGVAVQLVRFGAGFSVMRPMLGLPFSGVKLNPEMCRAAATQPDVRRGMESLLRIMQYVGLTATMTAVETAEDHHLAASLGADCAEGPFYGQVLTFHASTMPKYPAAQLTTTS